MPLSTRPLKITWFQSMAASAGGVPRGAPIVMDVVDDDVARADVAGDGGGEDPDRARAGDQHVLADHVEGERAVRRVAERVEERGDLVLDAGRELEGGG